MRLFRLLLAWLPCRRRERRRLLLSYWDGEHTRRADPFRLWRQLMNHPRANLVDMAPLVDQGHEPETTIVIEALAEVFAVKRWNGEFGLTDWEILNLLGALDEFLVALKKNTSPGPISPPPTASTS